MDPSKPYVIEEPICYYNKWDERVYLSEVMSKISNLNRHCVENSQDCVSLLWPGSIKQPGVVHSLSCLDDSANGKQEGQRTVLFPAKANSLTLLNELYLEPKFLQSIAFKNEQFKRFDNSSDPLTMALASKMALYSSHKKYSHQTSIAKPVLSELMAIFPVNTKSVEELERLNYSEKYFLRSRRATPRHCIKRTILDAGHLAGNSDTSPDSIFALHQSLNERELKRALSFLKKSRRKIDVIHIVLDHTYNQSHQIYQLTHKNLLLFFECLEDVFGSESPPVLAICSEIHWFKICESLMVKRSGTKQKIAPLLAGIDCPSVDHPLVSNREVTSDHVSSLEFVVHLTDNESSRIIRDWYGFKKMMVNRGLNAESVHWTIQFIRNLASLPGNVKDYYNWYGEKYGADALSQATWPHFESKVVTASSSLTPEERNERDRLCANTKNWIAKVQKGTPLAYEITRILNSDELKDWPVALVCTNEVTRELLEIFLEQELVDCSQVDILKQSELMTKNFYFDKYLAILPIDLTPEIKRRIFKQAKDVIVHLPLTELAAFNLRTEISTLLSLDGLKRYHPVLQPLKSKLDSRLSVFDGMPELYSVYARQPKSIRAYSNQSTVIGNNSQNVVCIRYDNGDTDYRGRQSSIYVRDSSIISELMSSFIRIKAEDITIGQEVFNFTESTREEIRDLLDGVIEIENTAKSTEQYVRAYHSRVLMLLKARYGSRYQRMNTARSLLAHMKAIWQETHPSTALNVNPNNICYWINLSKSSRCSSSELSTWAPKQEDIFFCFMQALDCDLDEASFYWEAITRFRTNRIQDGKSSNAQYMKILFDPSALRAYEGMSREVVEALELLVEKSLQTVTGIEFSMVCESPTL